MFLLSIKAIYFYAISRTSFFLMAAARSAPIDGSFDNAWVDSLNMASAFPKCDISCLALIGPISSIKFKAIW